MDAARISRLDRPFELKPYNSAELSRLYGISQFIFRKWTKAIRHELGERHGWYFSIQQVKLIVDTYGVPGQSVNDAA